MSQPNSKRRIATENSPENNKSSMLIVDYDKDSYDY